MNQETKQHDEATIRSALSRLTAAAFGDNRADCFRVPADLEHDADLILHAAVSELLRGRATIEAQSRLLSLAETLAGAVGGVENGNPPKPAEVAKLADAHNAFTAALTEYAQSGTVPCPECEALKPQLDGPLECFDCGSAIQGYCPHCDPLRLQAERDDLRRQLAATKRFPNALMTHQLAEAKANNAALVEAIGAALKPLLTECSCGYTIRDAEAIDQILEAALSQPHPGAPLLEELAALRDVVEALRVYEKTGDLDHLDGVWVHLATLDAIRNREGR